MFNEGLNEVRKQIQEIAMNSSPKRAKINSYTLLLKKAELKDPARDSTDPITVHDINEMKMDISDLEHGRTHKDV